MIIEQIYSKLKQDKKTNTYSESHGRSILKAISWRVFGTLDTILISWVIAQDLSVAFAIGSVELITKFILYYFHERIWNNIKFGK